MTRSVFSIIVTMMSFGTGIVSAQNFEPQNSNGYRLSDSIIVIKHIESAASYYQHNPDTAIEIVSNALEIAKQINYKNGLGECYGWLGYLYEQQGDYQNALVANKKSLEIKIETKDFKNVSALYNNIGAIYESLGDIKTALEHYHFSLKIDQKLGDQNGIALDYNNIGAVYKSQKDTVNARLFYVKSLKIRKEIDDKTGMAMSYNNIGVMDLDNGNYASAMKNLLKGLELYRSQKLSKGISYALNNIAKTYYEMGKIDSAFYYYKKSLKVAQTIKDKSGISTNFYNLAQLSYNTGQIEDALKYSKLGLEMSKKLNSPTNIRPLYKLLSELHEKNGNPNEALEYYKLYSIVKDSVLNKSNHKIIVKQQTKYAYEKQKALDDKQHEIQLAIEKEIERKQLIVTAFSIVVAFLTAIFLLIIYRRLQLTRKQKLVIEEQKEEVESQRDVIERQKDIVDEKNNEITSSISYAERIQNAILANKDTWSQIGSDRFIYFKPRDIVSGDFYWSFSNENYSIWVAADCTGHGVPGAFMSILGIGFLHQIVNENKVFESDEILNKLRYKIIGSLEHKYADSQQKDGMDLALCVLNKKTMELNFSGANNPLYLVRGGDLQLIKGDKMPVGKYEEGEEKTFSFESIKVESGDVIYTFSDGFADQFGGAKNKKYGYKAFRELLLANHNKPMEEQSLTLKKEFSSWIEYGTDEQIDDVCVVGVKI